MNFLLNLQNLSDLGLLVLRVAIGAIFLVHGLSKRKMWKMQPSEQMPAQMIRIMRTLSVAEPLGGLAVIVGFLTQIAAVGLGTIMLGAIYFKMKKWKLPFTTQSNTGWEFDFLILAGTLVLVFSGAGAFSIDRVALGL